MKITPITGMLLLAALSARVVVADTECHKTESSMKSLDWLYPLPDRAKLPSLAQVQGAGALVLIDEVIYNGDDRIYTLMAMLGDAASLEAFRSYTIGTEFAGFAVIKARMLAPDGKIVELEESDIHCTTVEIYYQKHWVGKSFTPKTYRFEFKNLVPGSVIQYQVSRRFHAGGVTNLQGRITRCEGNISHGGEAGYATGMSMSQMNQVSPSAMPSLNLNNNPMYCVVSDPWGEQYGNAFDVRAGAQGGLLGQTDPNFAARCRYPAANIHYVISLPKGMKLETKILPAGANVAVVEQPSRESSVEKIVTLQAKRSAAATEPGAPDFFDQSPVAVTFVRSVAGTSLIRPWRGYTDWNDWVNRYTSDMMQNTRADSGALAELLKNAPATLTAKSRGGGDHLDRYMRDQVANGQGYESRAGFGKYRTPLYIVAQGKTATPLEKALTLISLLKAAGMPASLVFVRPAGRQPIDRAFPMRDWFLRDLYLVAAETGSGRVFYDPLHPLAAGAIPARLQGGEGLLIKDRSTWEWVALPLSAEADNLTRIDITYTGIEADSLKGRLEYRLSGAPAEALRTELRGATAAAIRMRLLDLLDRGARTGVYFSAMTHENIDKPDEPLTIKANLLFSGALRNPAEKPLLILLPLQPGPSPALFASAAGRQQDVEFHVPERIEVAVRLPASLGKIGEARPLVTVSGPGIEYQTRLETAPDGATLHRTLSLHGRVATAQYGEFMAALRKLDLSDSAELALEK